MYKLAIFDLDGTILNTLEDLGDAANYVLKNHNLPLHSYQEYKYFVGNGIPKLVERMMPANSSAELHQQLLKEYIEYYKAHCAVKTAPYEGIIELLKQLRAHGIITAVNTNKVEAAAVDLCNTYFPELFDVVCGSLPQVPVKPAPDGVMNILAKVKISAGEAKNCCVYIGDSDVDIQTGLNAGIDSIGVDWGFRGKEFLLQHGAKKVAMSPMELLTLII